MKKLISLLLSLSMLFSLTVFANEGETVAGKITLTQFLGAGRDDTKSVALQLPNGGSAVVDSDIFFNIADEIILTSSLDPKETDMTGVYILVEMNNGTFKYAYVSEGGGVDKYSIAMSRLPYALYTTDDIDLVKELYSLVLKETTGGFVNAPHEWAISEIQKAKELGIVTVDKILYTAPIRREEFCEIAANTLEKAGKVFNTDNTALKPILDTDSIAALKLYQAGIINGKISDGEGIVVAPNEYITREEAAAILFRAARFMGIEMPETTDDLYYNDESDISDWAKPAVFTMKDMGIMQGAGSGKFMPEATLSGEEAILTMVRLYEYNNH